jgi:hypothetical protein
LFIYYKDFNEDDHPRDENGRFTEGGGGGSSSGKISNSSRESLPRQNRNIAIEIIKKDFEASGTQITTQEAEETYTATQKWVSDVGSASVRAIQNANNEREYNKIMQDKFADSEEYDGIDMPTYSEASNYSDNLENYIANSPAYEGEMYRGIEFKDAFERDLFMDGIQAGDPVDMRGTSSFTNDMDTADNFQGDRGTGVIFIYQSSKGSPTASVTHIFDGEGEVLLSKDASVRIKEIDENIIYLEDDI